MSLLFAAALILVIWLASYLYLVRYHGRWNLLHVTIHESGRYTFLGTVFYVNHFLREVPIDTLYVACIAWSFRATVPALGSSLKPWVPLIAGALVTFMVAVAVGSIRKVGIRNTLLDFLQFRELDTVTEYGSHWQMHFLSTLALMLILAWPGTLFPLQSVDACWLSALFAIFVVISLVLRTGPKALTDRRWLMHGAREILTFGLLLAVPAGIVLAGETGLPELNSLPPLAIGFSVLIAALGAYYGWTYLRSDVLDLAQGDFGMPYLIASHFFEHVLDMVYMVLLLLLLLSLPT